MAAVAILVVVLSPGGPQASKATSENQARKAPSADELSIRGIKLGMTREEVVALLGQPLEEEPDGYYADLFTVASYKERGYCADPGVTYNLQGRVVGVYGDHLEWNSGGLNSRSTLDTILHHFPNPSSEREAAFHPAFPGQYVYPERNLVIETEDPGLWESQRFLRAELQIPFLFPMCSYWWDAKTPEILARTARSSGDNRELLSQSEVIGCYLCTELIEQPIEYEGDRDPGSCPKCGHCALIGGSKTEMTTAYLEQVREAWFTPYGKSP